METNIAKFIDPDHQIADDILRKHCDLSFIEIHGFIASVICEPKYISHREWLTMVGLYDIDVNPKECNQNFAITLSRTLSCFMDISEKLSCARYDPLAELRNLAILENYKALENAAKVWSKGYIAGVDMGMLSLLDDEQMSELLSPMTILATSDSALRKSLKDCGIDKTVKIARQEAMQLLPESVNRVYQFWLNGNSIIPQEPEQEDDFSDVRPSNDASVMVH